MLDLKTVDVSSASQSTACNVVDAARSLGFIYVSNHSIPRSLIRQVFSLSSQLFRLSPEEKANYKISANNRGWSMMGSEKLDPATQQNGDFKEAFNIAAHSDQQVPRVLEENRELLKDFEKHCQDLCRRLFELLAIGLDLEKEYFSSKHNPSKVSGTITRLLYYPASLQRLDDTKGDIRAGAHTDYGSVTLLFQNPGQSGLEVLDPSSGRFESVPAPSPESDEEEIPILINVADQLTLWTAGQLKSTVHRVTSTYGGDRYSIAYFCHPDDDTILKPAESLKTQADAREPMNPELGAESVTAGEHLRRRLEATYSY